MTDLNRTAILDFLNFGVCCPGDTFWRKTVPSDIPHILQGRIPGSVVLKKLAEEAYCHLVSAVGRILTNGEVDSFAMSGGADSRLIFGIMHTHYPQKMNNLRFYCRVHPLLNERTDRDYLLAKTICNHFSIELNAEQPNIYPQAFLYPAHSNQKICLSGVWGGELLGGQLLSHMTFNLQELATYKSESNLQSYLKFLNIKFEFNNLLEIYFFLLNQSYITAFYSSPAWLKTSYLDNYTRSPFLDPDFLKFIFSAPDEHLSQYQIYREVLKTYFSDYLFVPVNNVFCSGAAATLKHWGSEPKSMSTETQIESVLNEKQKEILEFIQSLSPMKYTRYLKSVLPLIEKC